MNHCIDFSSDLTECIPKPAEYTPYEIERCSHIIIIVRCIAQLCVLMKDIHGLPQCIYCMLHKKRSKKNSI